MHAVAEISFLEQIEKTIRSHNDVTDKLIG